MSAPRRTQAENSERVVGLLRADPSRSDRSIGRAVGVSHATVAARRRQLERSGQIDPRPDRPEAARQAPSPRRAAARAKPTHAVRAMCGGGRDLSGRLTGQVWPVLTR